MNKIKKYFNITSFYGEDASVSNTETNVDIDVYIDGYGDSDIYDVYVDSDMYSDSDVYDVYDAYTDSDVYIDGYDDSDVYDVYDDIDGYDDSDIYSDSDVYIDSDEYVTNEDSDSDVFNELDSTPSNQEITQNPSCDTRNYKETNISYFFRLLKENFCYNGKIDNDIMIDFREGFRVMTFNLRRDAPGDGENNWQHRRDAAVKAIVKYAPDVICFQECMPTMAKYLIYRLSKYYDNAGVEVFTGREMRKSNLVFGEGLLTMWRKDLFDFKYKKVVKLFDGRWINLRRFMDVGLIVKATGQQVNIINTHFCHKSKEAQNKSWLKLKGYVSKLGRFYCCGDYNTDKSYSNVDIHLMMDDYSYNYKHKFSDTTMNFWGKRNVGEIVDYVFSDQELESFEILDDKVVGRFLSDHNPVVNTYKNI